MTFTPLNPAAGIKSIVRFAFGANPDADPATWTWTDVSAWVKSDVTIRKGRPDFSTTADPTQIDFDLDNTDGRFTPGNPLSPYWPNVVRNVPCQVQLTGFGDAAPYERATAFVNGWPLTPYVGVIAVRSHITASGKLRRLQTRRKPLKSALARAIPALPGLLAYWPMEDGSTATQSASAVVDGTPMSVRSGTAVFGAAGGPGTAASVDFTGSLVMLGQVPPAAAVTSWRVVSAADYTGPLTPGVTYDLIYILTSTGDVWTVGAAVGLTTTTITVTYVPPSSGLLAASIVTWPNTVPWHILDMTAVQNGANVDVGVRSGSNVWGTSTGFFTGITLGSVKEVRPGGDFGVAPSSTAVLMSHVAVSSPTTVNPSLTAPDLGSAVLGFATELATARETRVCGEQGIRITVTAGSLGTVQAMGAQEIATFADIAHSAESTDLGFLHDGGPNGDLAYRAFNLRYNVAVTLALDYNAGHLGDSFAGTLDDQRLVNDSTVSRPSGSSAEVADASATVEGDYDEGLTLNVATDSQLAPLAEARVAMGVYPGLRFPRIDLDMVRSPALAQQVVALTLGGRVTVSNLPQPLYPPGGVDQFIEGTFETIGADKWQLALTCSPASLARIAVVQDATNPWLVDAGSSSLNAGITATVTSVAIKTTSGPLWSTSGADYPALVLCDGEEMRITAMAGGASPQTATVVRSINGVVKSHLANAVVSLYRPAVIAL